MSHYWKHKIFSYINDLKPKSDLNVFQEVGCLWPEAKYKKSLCALVDAIIYFGLTVVSRVSS